MRREKEELHGGTTSNVEELKVAHERGELHQRVSNMPGPQATLCNEGRYSTTESTSQCLLVLLFLWPTTGFLAPMLHNAT